ncbi:MAG: hypothetical protein AAGD05_18195, partial [Bacteroidota bacterium]
MNILKQFFPFCFLLSLIACGNEDDLQPVDPDMPETPVDTCTHEYRFTTLIQHEQQFFRDSLFTRLIYNDLGQLVKSQSIADDGTLTDNNQWTYDAAGNCIGTGNIFNENNVDLRYEYDYVDGKRMETRYYNG